MLDDYTIEQVLIGHGDDQDHGDGWNYWDDQVPWRDGKEWSDPVEVDQPHPFDLGKRVSLTVDLGRTYTGGEGGGEDAELLFRVTEDSGEVRYFLKSGYYYSYDGTNWDGTFRRVTPVEKFVTVYE